MSDGHEPVIRGTQRCPPAESLHGLGLLCRKSSKAKKKKPKKKAGAEETGSTIGAQRAAPAKSAAVQLSCDSDRRQQQNAEHQGDHGARIQLTQHNWPRRSHAAAGAGLAADEASPADRWRDGSYDGPQSSAGSAGHEAKGASDGSDDASIDIGRLAQRLGSQWVISPAPAAAVSTVTSLRDFRPLGTAEPRGGAAELSDVALSDDSEDDDDASISDAESESSGDLSGLEVVQTVAPSAGNGSTAVMQRPAQAAGRARTRAPTSEVAAMSDVITRFMEGTHVNDSFRVPHAAAETAQLRLWRGEDGAITAQTPSGLLSVTLRWTFHPS